LGGAQFYIAEESIMRTDIDQHGKIDTYLSSYQKAIDCVERALGELAEAESLVAEFA